MRHRLFQIFSNRFPALLWTIFIFVLLALPGKMLPKEESYLPNLDKIIHVILFGSFVFLWCVYFASKPDKDSFLKRRFILILVVGCVYGIGMEFIQKYFIPNRAFDMLDILADVLGSTAGFLIARLMFNRLIKS
jgi:VanZ family protein